MPILKDEEEIEFKWDNKSYPEPFFLTYPRFGVKADDLIIGLGSKNASERRSRMSKTVQIKSKDDASRENKTKYKKE